jgi:hypothetical protein
MRKHGRCHHLACVQEPAAKARPRNVDALAVQVAPFRDPHAGAFGENLHVVASVEPDVAMTPSPRNRRSHHRPVSESE